MAQATDETQRTAIILGVLLVDGWHTVERGSYALSRPALTFEPTGVSWLERAGGSAPTCVRIFCRMSSILALRTTADVEEG